MLTDFQQRVIRERAELEEKADKLHAFITSAKFSSVDGDEQSRLLRQRNLMDKYVAVLDERIKAFQS